MNTLLLPASDESVARAAQLIKDGQLVGFPTETVYGLGADALNARAVLEIFAAKGRPADNPLIVHIARWEEMEPLCHINDMARKLAEAFWPGPLTMILPKKELVPAAVTAGLDSVAIRMPSHPVARALIEKSGCPIAAPSGNRSGRPSPTLAVHMMEDMDGRIPLILDGGPCDVGVESTVVALTGDVATVLRPGGVTPEMIASVCGAVEVDGAVMRPLREGETPRSPGMKYRHYAPVGQLTIVDGEAEAVAAKIRQLYAQAEGTAAILALPGHERYYEGLRLFDLGEDDSPESVAAHLFAVLRALDDEHIDTIFSEAVDAKGLGLAVMNRLGRAAAFRILHV